MRSLLGLNRINREMDSLNRTTKVVSIISTILETLNYAISNPCTKYDDGLCVRPVHQDTVL